MDPGKPVGFLPKDVDNSFPENRGYVFRNNYGGVREVIIFTRHRSHKQAIKNEKRNQHTFFRHRMKRVYSEEKFNTAYRITPPTVDAAHCTKAELFPGQASSVHRNRACPGIHTASSHPTGFWG
ncbi:hypothetical protein SDC9_147020 [bioreactor metagenome]|uniref:Uncharacterized protein n=1 Tax=bioreactor metagenome TaxID=1076179 RepID=A0A645EEH7_9ZZZZ